jgi:hypothetical protein
MVQLMLPLNYEEMMPLTLFHLNLKPEGLNNVPAFVFDLIFLTTNFFIGVFYLSIFSGLTSDVLNGFTFTFIGGCGAGVVSRVNNV